MEIKICGLREIDDVKLSLDCGSDYVGFILYPESPRYIDPLALAQLMDKLDGDYKAVGVFVNESADFVKKVADDSGLFAVQMHGDSEIAADFESMTTKVWRAIKIDGGIVVPSPDDWKAERYIVDSAVPDMYGGTGVTADWDRAKELATEIPIMIAGGLTPENVADAIEAVKPLGVDVAGGVESEPGKKDHAKIKAFIENVNA